ncbi:helix-turn-helix domain-containing protein, partial [Escherichia coli]|uniref:helix-turn-helix domain-containing protein n=2 Tax=Escherichia coli TaxID=562 RepID=UPI00202313FD
KKIGPDPRNFNQRVNLGRNDLLIRTFLSYRSVILTLSERKVLRLLGKGWGINQIASLLKKSNKTISAQKNSAMRRLAIHSNAEMYAWINSAQGARELNLPSVYGDAAEWNTAELRREMSHS